MMNDGTPPDAISAKLAALAAYEPDPEYDVLNPSARQLPGRHVRCVYPPRLSRKMIHALRHAAAKAFKHLGLATCARIKV